MVTNALTLLDSLSAGGGQRSTTPDKDVFSLLVFGLLLFSPLCFLLFSISHPSFSPCPFLSFLSSSHHSFSLYLLARTSPFSHSYRTLLLSSCAVFFIFHLLSSVSHLIPPLIFVSCQLPSFPLLFSLVTFLSIFVSFRFPSPVLHFLFPLLANVLIPTLHGFFIFPLFLFFILFPSLAVSFPFFLSFLPQSLFTSGRLSSSVVPSCAFSSSFVFLCFLSFQLASCPFLPFLPVKSVAAAASSRPQS